VKKNGGGVIARRRHSHRRQDRGIGGGKGDPAMDRIVGIGAAKIGQARAGRCQVFEKQM
jgi:hypothetical protein